MHALLLLLACPKQASVEPVPLPSPSLLDARPTVGPAADFTPPQPQVFTLDNGATVWFMETPGLPLVSVRMVVRGGRDMDPADQPGLTAFSNAMLTHGAGDLDASAFAAEVEQQALSLHASTGQATTWLSLEATTETLGSGLDLLFMAVTQPTFDADEVERVRDQRLGDIAQSLDTPATVASWVGDRVYFGAEHPLAHNTSGTAASLESLDAAQLKASWQQRMAPERTTFVICGDLVNGDGDADLLKSSLNAHFGDWTPSELAPLPEHPAPTGAAGYYLVDNPGSSQSILRVTLPGWQSDDPAYVPAELGSIVLGGTFTSRLNRLLREEKGYTYGARAGLGDGPGYGRMITYSAVRGDVTGLALVDMMGELERISAGIDAAELKKAQGAKRSDTVSVFETRSGMASAFADLAAMQQSPDTLAQELSASQSASVESVNAALAGIDPSAAIVVVVGDLSVIQPQLAEVLPDVTWTVVEP
ncbi:MAG: pitrilysin family protein [Myxococcota bacterium]|nr:pitrilysin family protein [Myxococcota bacterium]